MNPHTVQSGTYYNFTLDEPYARFLVFHSYLTCLYLPFTQNIIREEPHNHLYKFPPELRFSTYLAPFRIASHCLAITLSLPYTTPGDNPLPPDHILRAP